MQGQRLLLWDWLDPGGLLLAPCWPPARRRPPAQAGSALVARGASLVLVMSSPRISPEGRDSFLTVMGPIWHRVPVPEPTAVAQSGDILVGFDLGHLGGGSAQRSETRGLWAPQGGAGWFRRRGSGCRAGEDPIPALRWCFPALRGVRAPGICQLPRASRPRCSWQSCT